MSSVIVGIYRPKINLAYFLEERINSPGVLLTSPNTHSSICSERCMHVCMWVANFICYLQLIWRENKILARKHMKKFCVSNTWIHTYIHLCICMSLQNHDKGNYFTKNLYILKYLYIFIFFLQWKMLYKMSNYI